MTDRAEASRKLGFTGHQGLTSSTFEQVKAELLIYLDSLGPVRGLCSLAEGSDQLFADLVLTSGNELKVIVPCNNYESTFREPKALENYRRLKRAASEVVQLRHAGPSEEAFWDAGKRVAEESDQVIAVWDGKPAGGLGGTADVVAYAQRLGKPVRIVWPKGAQRN